MEDLRADWKAVKVKGRRRPIAPKAEPVEDLHEDWASVRGIKYPPYGYIIKWEYPTAFVIWKMKIVGKRRTRDGVFYRAEYAGIFFKSEGYRIDRYDKPDDGGYGRNVLLFTAEEVERSIEGHRRHHINNLFLETKRLHAAMEEMTNNLKYKADCLQIVRDDPMPLWMLEKLPRKAIKRLEADAE